TALVSALSSRSVRSDLAMTGEISLRGRVLPIGGVKEKVLGAHRAGIRHIMLPAQNRDDLQDLPIEVVRELEFEFVSDLAEVFRKALQSAPVSSTQRTERPSADGNGQPARTQPG